MKPVTIYTTPSCGYCFAAKRLLRGKGIAFEENAWLTISAFVTASLPHNVDRGRRILQIEEYENAGTIEGWAVQLEPEQVALKRE